MLAQSDRTLPTLCLLMAGLLGCESVTGPNLTSFVVLAEGHDVESIAPLVVTPRRGQVEVTASMRTPCSSYTASAILTLQSDTIFIEVTGDFAGQCPFDISGNLIYRALVDRLAAGQYWLLVRHDWATNDWPVEIPVDRSVSIF